MIPLSMSLSDLCPGFRVSQVKPSNCFRLHTKSVISKHSNSYRENLWYCDFSQQSRFLTARRRLEKFVFDTSFILDDANLAVLSNNNLNERMWHFRGQNILWPLIHIFREARPLTPRIYAPGDADFLRMHSAVWRPDLTGANVLASCRETWRLFVEPACLLCVYLLLLGSLVTRISLPAFSSTMEVRRSGKDLFNAFGTYEDRQHSGADSVTSSCSCVVRLKFSAECHKHCILQFGSVVVRALDLQSAGRGFDSGPPHCRVATLGKSFTRAQRLSEVTTV